MTTVIWILLALFLALVAVGIAFDIWASWRLLRAVLREQRQAGPDPE